MFLLGSKKTMAFRHANSVSSICTSFNGFTSSSKTREPTLLMSKSDGIPLSIYMGKISLDKCKSKKTDIHTIKLRFIYLSWYNILHHHNFYNKTMIRFSSGGLIYIEKNNNGKHLWKSYNNS